jgi:hypothetical protein
MVWIKNGTMMYANDMDTAYRRIEEDRNQSDYFKDKEFIVERVYDKGKYRYEIYGIRETVKCPICGYENAYKDVCDMCGARVVDGEWKVICRECNKEVDKLYGLFVPHMCKECYDKEKERQIKCGERCSLCGKPYIDCCC